MLLRAAKELGINLAQSFMVGDKPSDIAAGKSAGTRSIMINPAGDPGSLSDECQPDWFARNLLTAVERILDQC
jgi:D-glycero-D-manno-heptose 1,7-bisphosphate phosphatase